MSELINQKQLEEALQISRSTIYRLRKEGMPFYTIGDQVRFDIDEVKAWMQKPIEEVQESKGIESNFFEFPITDFEEVYAVIDRENNRLHVSSVNYSYSITLDLTKDLNVEIDEQTKWGDQNFNKRVRQVLVKIIEELNL